MSSRCACNMPFRMTARMHSPAVKLSTKELTVENFLGGGLPPICIRIFMQYKLKNEQFTAICVLYQRYLRRLQWKINNYFISLKNKITFN